MNLGNNYLTENNSVKVITAYKNKKSKLHTCEMHKLVFIITLLGYRPLTRRDALELSFSKLSRVLSYKDTF